ncbi:hypothetical protein PIROE2DRAFT_4794 [Piromyces sp. E2]|nr:hypothetical protein PIROE2DRAFT_4794 [Piromyces sp. E2]|eukprot:OUM67721.1 hypothetical protein PIROE2DRAFT_4794 [Piromyces sp. E2]
MKFVNALLTLATASSVFSFTINTNRGLYLTDNSNDDPYVKFVYNKLIKECRDDLDKTGIFIECTSVKNYNMNNYEEMCKNRSSPSCVKFFEDPLAEAPNCKNDQIYNNFIAVTRDYNPKENYNCLRITDNKLCPTVIQTFETGSFHDEAVKETCKSKACTEGLIKQFESSIKNAEINNNLFNTDEGSNNIATLEEQINVYKTFIELLKSPQCTAQAVDDLAQSSYIVAEAEEKSSTYNIKTTSVLFTTLSLLLAYLL